MSVPTTVTELAKLIQSQQIVVKVDETELSVDPLADLDGTDCYPSTLIMFMFQKELLLSLWCWKLGWYEKGPNRRDTGEFIGTGWRWLTAESDGASRGRPCYFKHPHLADMLVWQTTDGTGEGIGLINDDETNSSAEIIQAAIDAAYGLIEVRPASDSEVNHSLTLQNPVYSCDVVLAGKNATLRIFSSTDAGRPVFTHNSTGEVWTDADECADDFIQWISEYSPDAEELKDTSFKTHLVDLLEKNIKE